MDLKLGEVVFEDGRFKIVYGGVTKRRSHGFVAYMLFRSHWTRIGKADNFQPLIDEISRIRNDSVPPV